METVRHGERKSRRALRTVATLGASALFVAVAGTCAERTDPEHAYRTASTENGNCLDGSPYDPEEGALINTHRIDEADALAVMPRDANSHRPSVLFLIINNNGISQPSLSPLDFATGGFLANAGCPKQSDGY